MGRKIIVTAFLFLLITLPFVNCKNKEPSINTYTFIINMDSLEFYRHPLKNRDELQSLVIDNFNTKDFINKSGIKKNDSILIKMIEAADCIPKAVNLCYSFEQEGFNKVELKQFDNNEFHILGLKNHILFDSTMNMELNVPKMKHN